MLQRGERPNADIADDGNQLEEFDFKDVK